MGEHQLSAAQVDNNTSLGGWQVRQLVPQERMNHVFDCLHAQPVSPIDLIIPNDC